MRPFNAPHHRVLGGLCCALGLACGEHKPAPPGAASVEDSSADANLDSAPVAQPGLEARPLPACDPSARAALGPFSPPFEPSAPTTAGFQHGDSVTVEDVNGDGHLDLLLPDRTRARLLMGDGGGGFTDGTAASLPPGAAADPHDADLDVLVAYGEGEDDEAAGANPADEPDGLYLNDGASRFTEASAAAGIDDEGVGRTFVPADLNGDGWLDLVAHGHLEPPRVYLARCGEAPSALLQLVGRRPPNTGAVGARITVEAGGHTQTRWVRVMGSGFSSGAPLQAHVGLGAAERIDRLTVRWPDGVEQTWTDLPARHHLTIRQDQAR